MCKCSVTVVREFTIGGCSRKAVVYREGIPYCKQHDPVKLSIEDSIRDLEYELSSNLCQLSRLLQDLGEAVVERLGASPDASVTPVAKQLLPPIQDLMKANRAIPAQRDKLRQELDSISYE